MPQPLQPVLVLPVYRGGLKFERALDSVLASEQFFRRIIVSLNGPHDSVDVERATRYTQAHDSKVELITTGEELPWMEHQYFWLGHLERTGEDGSTWAYWFAHDDQIRPRGIEALVDAHGNWPLNPKTIYLGPWGMRYDPLGSMYEGSPGAPLESWTSFPVAGPKRLKVAEWIAQQFEQPTYINMSGCVTQLSSFQALRAFPYAKPGGMRIEMATAAAPNNVAVEEFQEPVVITYTSKGSDRTTYTEVARKDDRHMLVWLANYIARHPTGVVPTLRAALTLARSRMRVLVGRGEPIQEDWRYRETVAP